MSTIPPTIPMICFTNGLFAIVSKPTVNNMMRENSTTVWERENTRPVFAPDCDPWLIVAKNKGPGARAPEAVTKTTVRMN